MAGDGRLSSMRKTIELTLGIKGWRRNVEAGLFATTLRDHFRDHADCLRRFGATKALTTPATDEWAFEFVDIKYLQQLKEAFDEDGSGYITIREVNRLTELLPDSVPWR